MFKATGSPRGERLMESLSSILVWLSFASRVSSLKLEPSGCDAIASVKATNVGGSEVNSESSELARIVLLLVGRCPISVKSSPLTISVDLLASTLEVLF